MTLTEEAYLDLERRFKEITALTRVKSDDPESEIFTRRKAVIKTLKMIGIITILVKRATPDDNLVKLNGMLAASFFLLGNIYNIYCLNEGRSIQKYLMMSLMIIEKFGGNSYFMMLKQVVLNLLGKIVLRAGNPQGALSYLGKAEKVYWKSRELTLVNIEDMFLTTPRNNRKVNRNLLDNNYAESMYYRADVYSNLNDELKAAILKHTGLEILFDCKYFDHDSWVRTAALTSKTFIHKRGFKQARHLLAAAHYVFDKIDSMASYVNNYIDEELRLKLSRLKADLFEAWGCYGLELLRFSKHVTLPGCNGNFSTDLAQAELENTSVTKQEIEDMIFMKLRIVKYENQITDQIVATTLDARRVFKNVEKWLDMSLSFYSDPSCEFYTGIMINKSLAYLSLSLFEHDYKMKTSLLQKRIDVLEKLCSTIDQLSNADLRREIWQFLGRSYYDFVDVARQINTDDSAIAPVNTINSYIKKSTENFRNFINCFRNQSTNKYPERITEIYDELSFLAAHVKIAFLLQQLMKPTSQEALKHAAESKSLLLVVVDYCERNPDAQKHLQVEYIKDKIIYMYLKMIEDLAEN